MYTVVFYRWKPGNKWDQPEILEQTEQITTAAQWYKDFIASGQKLDLKPKEGALIAIFYYKSKISEYFIEPLND